ncbi:MAG: amidohydrolase family protein [Fuerstiella sp.]|nr:amidohydrolase family protein [Fuerstiella sp.]
MTTTRRDFLSQSTSAVAASVIGAASLSRTEGAPTTIQSLPIIDTHQHLWDLRQFHLPWMDPNSEELEPIRHTFLMPDYIEHTKGLNVVKTVYMEINVHPSQQQAEADYVIDLCERKDNSMVGAVIGGYPQDDGFADYITPLSKKDAVKGVRTVLNDPDRPTGMCLQPKFVDNIRRLSDLGINFDLCLRPNEVIHGATLAKKCPNTRFVMDHCGNLSVQSTDQALRTQWQDGIRAAADQENMFIKISGIVASVNKHDWSPDDLAPNINFCLDTFGEDRCVYGGDWPVCLLGATYRQWVEALKEVVSSRSTTFQRKMFHDNAVKVYRLG